MVHSRIWCQMIRMASWCRAGGLVLMTFLALPVAACCQLSLGVQGGIGSFTVKGHPPEKMDYARSWGGTAGLVLEWNVTDAVALSLQPSWSQKGTGVKVSVRGAREPVDSMALRLEYLSLPVIVKVATRNRGGFVTAGVDLGRLNSATLSIGDSETIDVEDRLEAADLSVLFGVGGTLRKGSPAITFEIRYSQSLLRVLPLSAAGEETSALPQGFRSSGLQVIGGIEFPLGRRNR